MNGSIASAAGTTVKLNVGLHCHHLEVVYQDERS